MWKEIENWYLSVDIWTWETVRKQSKQIYRDEPVPVLGTAGTKQAGDTTTIL